MKYRRLFGSLLIVVYLLADYFGAALVSLAFGGEADNRELVAFGPVGLCGSMIGLLVLILGYGVKSWVYRWWEWVNDR